MCIVYLCICIGVAGPRSNWAKTEAFLQLSCFSTVGNDTDDDDGDGDDIDDDSELIQDIWIMTTELDSAQKAWSGL